MIRLEGLTKRFGTTVAVDGLDLEVRPGRVTGFLGPNGAGKSTTIDILLGYVTPTEGEVDIFDRDAHRDSVEAHRRIGVLPDA